MTFLVWHGHKHLIKSPQTVVPALFRAVAATDVGTAWLNALPPGTDIGPVQVSRKGDRSAAAGGFHNGDVLLLTSLSGPQYYLVLDTGIVPITDLQFTVINALTPTTPIPVTSQAIGGAAPPAADATDPPATPPHLAAGGQVCATTGADGVPLIVTDATVDGLAKATPTPGISADHWPLADAVLVPAGRVCVLRAVDAGGSTVGTYRVVTDIGVAFPVPDATVLPLLGYSAAQAVDIPAYLAKLIPTGPSLDPAAAVLPFNIG
jgi:hypothetical protein